MSACWFLVADRALRRPRGPLIDSGSAIEHLEEGLVGAEVMACREPRQYSWVRTFQHAVADCFARLPRLQWKRIYVRMGEEGVTRPVAHQTQGREKSYLCVRLINRQRPAGSIPSMHGQGSPRDVGRWGRWGHHSRCFWSWGSC